MSQSSNHLRLVSWTWQWVHFTQMASTVTRSQSNRAPLGCGGTRDSWMCSRQICSNCVMLSCQNGPKSLSNVSNNLLNLCHEELRQFWRQKWVQPGASKVYLIKWVCVCVYIYIWDYFNEILLQKYDSQRIITENYKKKLLLITEFTWLFKILNFILFQPRKSQS